VYRSYGSDFDSSGRDLMLSNPSNAFRRYDGVQLIATRRFAGRWQGQMSYSWSRSSGTVGNEYHTNATYWSLSPLGSVGADKNLAVRSPGQPKYDYSEFKAIGSCRFSRLGGLTAGGAFRWHNGVRWHRSVAMWDPFPLYFAAEPAGSRRTPSLGSLDLRVDKQVPIPPAGTLAVYVDVFNVTNVGRPTDYNPTSGPFFGRVGGWTDPRTARLGVRFEF
jgi:hypothetical protein